MTQIHTRTIQIGDWSFELKSVRALKVEQYGKPYTAIANCNINGDSMYVDGLLTKNDEELNKKDFASFYKFCQEMGIGSCNYHRFQGGESVSKVVTVFPDKKAKCQVPATQDSKADAIEFNENQTAIPSMRLVK